MRKREAGRDSADTLRLLIAGTVSETGTDFFRALVRNLARALGTAGAWVTEYHPEAGQLRALAMWLNGQFVDHYEYKIAGTPCAAVVENRALIHVPEMVIDLYPGDHDLKPMHAVSYLGTPLLNPDGRVLGHLSVLDTKPMPRNDGLVSLFEIFAARAAAEHRRLKIERELREREEALSLLLHNALDAIVVLDGRLTIVRVNPAAERLFACSAEDLLGERIQDFLTPETTGRLEAGLREIEGRPPGQQQLWLPQDFTVRRWDHSVLAAEATLSRFENRQRTYLTLILRSAEEREEAERRLRRLLPQTGAVEDATGKWPRRSELLGRSDAMRAVCEAIWRVAGMDATVLITGETGTGKDLVARSLHRASGRADKPLVLVNCAAIPANLIESELFGHERGAFTGAMHRREGRFALADGGTLFLDEVDELPLEFQPKLLRVLQEGEFEPLGSTKTSKVNVRVVAATHRDLKQMVKERRFREDLFFRLHVFPIAIPSLRERGQDIDHLATAFVQRFARHMGKHLDPLTHEPLARLRSYDWPGNVRELQNVIERALILSSGPRLELDRALGGCGPPPQPKTPVAADDGQGRILTAREMEALERANLERALACSAGKIAGEGGAARRLGIAPSTLTSRLRALAIDKTKSRSRSGAAQVKPLPSHLDTAANADDRVREGHE